MSGALKLGLISFVFFICANTFLSRRFEPGAAMILIAFKAAPYLPTLAIRSPSPAFLSKSVDPGTII